MKKSLIVRLIAAMLLLMLVFTCIGCANKTESPKEANLASPYAVPLQNLERTKRPIVAVSDVQTTVFLFTTSTEIPSNVFTFSKDSIPFKSLDGMDLALKAENFDTSMMFNLNQLTTYNDIISVVADGNLSGSPIKYSDNGFAVSFTADKFSGIDFTFKDYYVLGLVEAGKFTYSVSWTNEAGNVTQLITIAGNVDKTAYLEFFFNGSEFVVQSDAMIIDPQVITWGIRSADYDTITIHPSQAPRYNITILDDGTAELVASESEITITNDNVDGENETTSPTTVPENNSSESTDVTNATEPTETEQIGD